MGCQLKILKSFISFIISLFIYFIYLFFARFDFFRGGGRKGGLGEGLNILPVTGYFLFLIHVINIFSFFLQVPEIDELERAMHALLKNRASTVVQRRQMDVSDQAGDFLNAQAGNYMYMYNQLIIFNFKIM